MRTLAALISLGRFVFGAAFIAQPSLLEGAWIGRQALAPESLGHREADSPKDLD